MYIITLYRKIFYNRSDYDFKVNILIKNLVTIIDPQIIDDYSSYMTEIYRKYINSFISQTLYILPEHTRLFVTGGDAYRRYIPDIITTTNDIDIKLAYSDKKDYKQLLNMTILEMSKLVNLLYQHKPIKENNEWNKIIFNNDNIRIDIKFIPIYEIGQYRLRYIENEDFTLLSIDYRYKYKITINRDSLEINEEFALLDVVLYNDNKYLDLKKKLEREEREYQFVKLEKKFKRYKNIYNTNDFLPKVYFDGDIPIASAKFLINDLREIYDEISDNLTARFTKNAKDQNRFENLLKYLKTNYQKTGLGLGLERGLKRKNMESIVIRKIDTSIAPPQSKVLRTKKRQVTEEELARSLEMISLEMISLNDTRGTGLNISFNHKYYVKLINNPNDLIVSRKYADNFIKKINDNNKLKKSKKYKIKMGFDEIKNFYYRYHNNDMTHCDSDCDCKQEFKEHESCNSDCACHNDGACHNSTGYVDNFLSNLDVI